MIRNLRSFNWVGYMGLLMAAALMTMSGCGSTPAGPTGPPQDQQLERYNRAAQQAFERDRLSQAANFYRRALERAYVRDDTGAILNARYNLAVCLLHLQSYEEALEVVRRAKTEMALSDYGKSADFLLLEATLLHRLGDTDAAWQIIDQILSGSPQAASVIRSKTLFLRGLIASERSDLDQLRASIADLGQPDEIQLRANRQELLGRLAMAERDLDAAGEAFVRTANLRREAIDYRGMARALVLAGEANEKAGRSREAAILYLRAGRSAFFKDQVVDAEKWLNHSVRLASTAGEDDIIQEARGHLRQIEALNATH